MNHKQIISMLVIVTFGAIISFLIRNTNYVWIYLLGFIIGEICQLTTCALSNR